MKPSSAALVAATLAVAALVPALTTTGCSSQPKQPAKAPPETVRKGPPVRPEPFDPFPVVAVNKIAVGRGHVGYLKTKEEPPNSPRPIRTYWVYDSFFEAKGFYTVGGATFRFVDKGDAKDLGHMTADRAMKMLLGVKSDEPVELLPMDRVRSIEPPAPAEPAAGG